MELWIRSQDKEQLTKVDNLFIDDEYVKDFPICDSGAVLGRYATKERALEVLDEIKFAILFGGASYEEVRRQDENINSWWAANRNTGVIIYEMPKE